MVRCTACTARATIAHATRERGHPPPLPDPLRRSFISLKRRALAPLAWLSHLAVLGGRRGRTGRCCLRSPSALRGEGDRGRWGAGTDRMPARGELPITALCEDYGISRKTGYKWLGRYREHGPEGLVERCVRSAACGRASPPCRPSGVPHLIRDGESRRGTGGGGPVVCATLSRARDPICCAHDPFAAPATFQARATRACRTRFRAHDPSGVRKTACPAESHLSHLSHLIPANPALRKLLVSRARHAPICRAHLRGRLGRTGLDFARTRAIGQGERTALEGCESLPGVRCARTGPALQSSRRCGLGGPCDRPNDGTVGPRRRTVEAPWRCGSARSSRKPASCIEE